MATKPFTEHPRAVGETFGEHFGVAMGVSRRLAAAAGAAFVHAMLPMFHETTASDHIRALNRSLDDNNRHSLRHDALPDQERGDHLSGS